MNNKKISYFIVFIIIYCILASAGASLVPSYSFWIDFVAAIICFSYFSQNKALNITPLSLIASLLLIIAAAYTIRGGTFFGYVGKAMTVSLAVVVLNLKDNWRVNLLQIISKWFAVLLFISVVVWLIHLVIPLPHSTYMEDNNWGFSRAVHNYYFFREIDETVTDIKRFQSMFLEPGHLGTICLFFLVVNCFNLKKRENIVFLVCAILSLSASTYVLLTVGYLFYRYSENRSRQLIVSALFIAALVVFFASYNNGENIVNEIIFGKLTREEGAVEGRVSLEVLATYESMWETGTDLLYGKGIFSDMDVLGAGFILYFVQHGLLGSALLFIAYLFIFLSCKSRYGFLVFVLYIVSFLQRTYPFWDAFSLPYILGLPYFISMFNIKKPKVHLVDNGVNYESKEF